MSDEPLSECQECDAAAERVLHPVAVHFKGSGFYNTDYGRKKGGGNGAGSDGAREHSDSKGSEGKSSEAKSGDSKSKTATASGD
jgi:hypothetical protein